MKDKVAVVTGGGRGIGKEISLLLAQEGASVLVNDTGCEIDGTSSSNQPANQVVSEIKSNGGNALANYADVSLMENGEAIIKSAIDNFGHLDILVNSAGILKDRMIYHMSPQEFDLVIRNNVKGMFTTTKFASILFRQQRGGRIVNMTSDAGLGAIGRSNFGASSEAIVGLTRTVARDLGKYGVTCNAISPMVETRLFPGTVDEFRVIEGPKPTPDQRAGIGPSKTLDDWTGAGYHDAPENVAPLAVYLCSDISEDINGNVFGIRGNSIYLYSNPDIEKSIYKWGKFTMDEMDELVPKMFGMGF